MPKKNVYTIATAHLDTIWCWDFETTVSKYIYNTLKDNFELFEKYPDYKFNFEGSYRYELMREYYPEMWEKMRNYVKEGRWNVCGSAFENGDVNIPSPEALFRNILIGNGYFEKNFGVRSTDIFLPDCFGFGYALPSIMRHANLNGFTTQKLTWGSAYGVPFDIGKWYGVDGNFVYACTNPGAYVSTLNEVRNSDFIKNKLEENEKFGLNMTAVFHGTGDRGGAPKERSVKTVCNEIAANKENDVQIISAAADKIYFDIENLPDGTKQKLPVWNNELVMQNHAVGGYTSRAIGKRWNRRNEEIADMAERSCTAAFAVLGYEYPQEQLTKAWKRVITHQFHDDLPGTSVQRAYRRSWNDYAMSLNQFTAEYEAAVKVIASQLDTSFVKGTAIVVNNPMEYERTGIVTVKLPARLYYKNAALFDADGKEYPAQLTDIKDGFATVLICVTVPPMGYKVYDLRNRKSSVSQKLRVSHTALENEKYSVKLNSNGDICSIFDKKLDREILKRPVITGIFDYNGSPHWPAWELNFDELDREPQHKSIIKSIEIVENGSCRVALKITKTYNDSVFTSVIALTRGGETVEVYTETEWRSLCSACKEIFSFTAESKTASYDLGLGAIKRGNMSEKLFEVPAQKWADISDGKKDFGVSVISECKYGWDKFDDSTLRLTLIHTPRKNYRIDSMQSMMDMGLNRYSYAIYSHKGEVSRDTQKRARDFIMPMASFICSVHKGSLGTEFSFGKLSNDGAILRAVKKAENSDEIIIRVGEGEKKEQRNVEFSLCREIESAGEIFASEEYIRDAEVRDGKLIFDLKPYEIKSFALRVKKEPNTVFCQTPLSFTGNVTAITPNSASKGTLPHISESIPAELFPDNVYVGGIRFKMPSDGKALLCGGQSFALPENTKRVHLLAASLDGDKTVKIGERAVKINDIKEYYAAWDLYDFKEAAYTKDGSLGYEFTHSHGDFGDKIASQLFFWHIVAEIGSADTLALPMDRNIIVLAATADSESNTCALSCELYDKIKGRRFDYKMNAREKAAYLTGKSYFKLNDKGHAFTYRNKGRKK